MASYYGEKRKMNISLNQILEAIKAKGITGSKNEIIFNLTNKFEVGELTIIKRLDFLTKIHNKMKIIDDEIYFED